MNMNINSAIKTFTDALKKHSPEILTGLGVAGMITGTVLAVKATPAAMDDIADARNEKGSKLTKKEVVKATWKRYIPTAISCGAGVACVVGASATNYKRNAALSAAYTLSQKSLDTFKESVRETISDKEYKKVTEKIAEKQIKESPQTESNTIVAAPGGSKVQFFEPITNRYFYMEKLAFDKAVLAADRAILNDGELYLGEWFAMLGDKGIDGTDIDYIMGWRASNPDKRLDIGLTPQLLENDTLCLVIDYQWWPPVSLV